MSKEWVDYGVSLKQQANTEWEMKERVDKVAKRCKMATKQHGMPSTLKPRHSVSTKATTG